MLTQYLYGYSTNNEIYITSKEIKKLSLEQALCLVNDLIKEYPSNPECHMIKGDLFYLDGSSYSDAIESYSKAIEISNTTAIPYHARGLLYIDTKEFYYAIDDFTIVIENLTLEHRTYVLNDCYTFRVIAYCSVGSWSQALKDIDLVDENFITYNTSISGMINKNRLISCIENKIILK